MDAPVVAFDCEWGFRGRRRDCETSWEPVVACAEVGGCAFSFRGRDARLGAFVDAHRSATWVAHSATAELKYLLRLGIEPPPRWFDTMVAFRVVSNRPGHLSASLVAALHATGLGHLAPPDKDAIRGRIVDLDFAPEDWPAVVRYCHQDVTAAAALYDRLAGRVDPTAMHLWSAYLAAVARLELRGVPIDTPALKRILANRDHLRDEIRRRANETAAVFRRDGSFSSKAFLRWARAQGVRWPRRLNERGREYPPLDDETLKAVEHRHSFIAQVRQARKTLRSLNKFPMLVDGRSRRHHFGAMPFRSVTGRNQPTRFVFGGPKWLRWLIVPPDKDHVLVYADYSGQEIGVAAALSGDRAMRGMYAADDPHMRFALMAGAAPAGATRHTHPEVRKIYKTVNLAVLYGQTAEGIADRLGIEHDSARDLLGRHRALFGGYHAWSDRIVAAAFDRGYAVTRCGWRARVEPDSKWRTWANFPIQSTGADIMRMTTIALDRQGAQILAPVHDAWLVAARRDQVPQVREAIEHARAAACGAVLGGFPLKMDVKVYADRFEDEDGADAWRFIQSRLPEDQPHVPSE